jgi:hypothetical protein
VALVLYWKQRAWRGQGAAVAGGGLLSMLYRRAQV